MTSIGQKLRLDEQQSPQAPTAPKNLPAKKSPYSRYASWLPTTKTALTAAGILTALGAIYYTLQRAPANPIPPKPPLPLPDLSGPNPVLMTVLGMGMATGLTWLMTSGGSTRTNLNPLKQHSFTIDKWKKDPTYENFKAMIDQLKETAAVLKDKGSIFIPNLSDHIYDCLIVESNDSEDFITTLKTTFNILFQYDKKQAVQLAQQCYFDHRFKTSGKKIGEVRTPLFMAYQSILEKISNDPDTKDSDEICWTYELKESKTGSDQYSANFLSNVGSELNSFLHSESDNPFSILDDTNDNYDGDPSFETSFNSDDFELETEADSAAFEEAQRNERKDKFLSGFEKIDTLITELEQSDAKPACGKPLLDILESQINYLRNSFPEPYSEYQKKIFNSVTRVFPLLLKKDSESAFKLLKISCLSKDSLIRVILSYFLNNESEWIIKNNNINKKNSIYDYKHINLSHFFKILPLINNDEDLMKLFIEKLNYIVRDNLDSPLLGHSPILYCILKHCLLSKNYELTFSLTKEICFAQINSRKETSEWEPDSVFSQIQSMETLIKQIYEELAFKSPETAEKLENLMLAHPNLLKKTMSLYPNLADYPRKSKYFWIYDNSTPKNSRQLDQQGIAQFIYSDPDEIHPRYAQNVIESKPTISNTETASQPSLK